MRKHEEDFTLAPSTYLDCQDTYTVYRTLQLLRRLSADERALLPPINVPAWAKSCLDELHAMLRRSTSEGGRIAIDVDGDSLVLRGLEECARMRSEDPATTASVAVEEMISRYRIDEAA